MTHQCGVAQLRSLKETLSLAAWLKEKNPKSLKESVGKKLQEIAKKSGTDKANITEQLFNSTLDNLSDLHKKIVNGSGEGSYGIYSKTHEGGHDSNTDQCAKNIAATFVAVLPRLHATLNYMLPKVYNPTEIYGRGNWIKQKCNGPNAHSTFGETLFDFLTDDGRDYDDGYNTMLYGGYTREGNELSENTGSALENPLQKLLGTGIEDAGTASLRKLLDALGLLSYDMSAVYLSAAAVLGTLGVGGATVVATNFMGWGTALYALLGFA
ncbi:ABC transporter ATP-binding protein [Babesia caballi]|uniref:ABC transporter ATP-binding protein n=1 Tax=Babesia caballi TaxID=5871 RepID=A0AAV4M4U2_BABCB|nr:ABC transporter ATP-binding protein [Babesia caballi]